MEKFTDMLSVGGRTNSLGRANEVIGAVLKDRSLLEELYASLFYDDAWVRMRAADCLEKICRVHPDWVEYYIDPMLDGLTTSSQPSIQWHLAQILTEVNLTNDQRERAIIWLKRLLSSKDVDWIVSANAMKALVQFYSDGFATKGELVPLFELQHLHKSNTVRKKAAYFLENL